LWPLRLSRSGGFYTRRSFFAGLCRNMPITNARAGDLSHLYGDHASMTGS